MRISKWAFFLRIIKPIYYATACLLTLLIMRAPNKHSLSSSRLLRFEGIDFYTAPFRQALSRSLPQSIQVHREIPRLIYNIMSARLSPLEVSLVSVLLNLYRTTSPVREPDEGAAIQAAILSTDTYEKTALITGL